MSTKTGSISKVAEKKDKIAAAYQGVAHDQVPNPTVVKWRTVIFSAGTGDGDETEAYEFRLLGSRDQVYREALRRLCYDVWGMKKDEVASVDAFLKFVDESTDSYGGHEIRTAMAASIESIRISETCPHCHR